MRLEDTDKSLEIVEGDGVGQQVVLKSAFYLGNQSPDPLLSRQVLFH